MNVSPGGYRTSQENDELRPDKDMPALSCLMPETAVMPSCEYAVICTEKMKVRGVRRAIPSVVAHAGHATHAAAHATHATRGHSLGCCGFG
jgi:hypothetical protein